MSTTYWIASYPKSGNTWFRIFLNNLLHEDTTAVRINDLPVQNAIGSARLPFDLGLGLKSSDLLADEIDCLRPRVDELLQPPGDLPLFRKIHDAYLDTACGEPIASRHATAGAIYLLRNPLDIVVSYAHHANDTVDALIARLNDPQAAIGGAREGLHEQLRQRLSDWSTHVRSWTEQRDFPVCVLRYEDMLERPAEQFTEAVRFVGFEHHASEIAAAIEAARFDRLQAQEQQGRFRETPRAASHFFRKGQAGDWRNHLSDAQVRAVLEAHGETMRHWGYTPE